MRDALEALERRERFEVRSEEDFFDPRAWQGNPYDPAVAILRQAFGPRPATELAALADRLAEMRADTTLPRDVRNNAGSALSFAANPGSDRKGTPYPLAFDILVRVYETSAPGRNARLALLDVHSADPERGPAYVRDLFERSERPAPCFKSHVRVPGDLPSCERGYDDVPWCQAGRILYRDIVRDAEARTWPRGRPVISGEPLPVPDGLPEHVEDWHRRCR